MLQRKTAAGSARAGMLNLNSWILGLQYACCFGVELHVNNAMSMYLFDNFNLTRAKAGMLASLFGWM